MKVLLAERALQIALRDVGVREQPPGSNRGPRVDVYLETAGVEPGEPYCASAIYTWFAEAAADMTAHGLVVASPVPKTGYCPSLANWGKQAGRVLADPSAAQPGDILLLHYDSLGRFAHTEIVSANAGGGTLHTVGANTNDDGGREGVGVFAKVRGVAGTKHIVLSMQAEGAEVVAAPPLTAKVYNAHGELIGGPERGDAVFWRAPGRLAVDVAAAGRLFGAAVRFVPGLNVVEFRDAGPSKVVEATK